MSKVDDCGGSPALDAKVEPDDREKLEINASRRRMRTRRHPVQFAFETAASGEMRIEAPHSDLEGALDRQVDAFGTASLDFAAQQIAGLEMCGRARGAKMWDSPAGVNAGLAMVEAIRPDNELEAALAVQMACVHNLATDMLGRAKQTDRPDHIALYGGLAVKLARTFTGQVEALAKLRGGGKQLVEVKHVHINGNAVVGHLHAGGAPETGSDGRPLAPSLPIAAGTPLRGAVEAEWEALPVASSEGAHALPDARRR
ncbi:hypothetical protein JKL49_11245 [Phenylobacterium sp. 20VBR1]|uniref:Uncharacterized protein n=1 Tax=Phenylobacterium glaciei TaxID=2803784 RepID=A0A941HWY3_9CAUL|nr:hypothetical protein [Phenylobacterium glaciei]MBR7619965.1 hypothetical protein [Phenylobacterium glaciei]